MLRPGGRVSCGCSRTCCPVFMTDSCPSPRWAQHPELLQLTVSLEVSLLSRTNNQVASTRDMSVHNARVGWQIPGRRTGWWKDICIYNPHGPHPLRAVNAGGRCARDRVATHPARTPAPGPVCQ